MVKYRNSPEGRDTHVLASLVALIGAFSDSFWPVIGQKTVLIFCILVIMIRIKAIQIRETNYFL